MLKIFNILYMSTNTLEKTNQIVEAYLNDDTLFNPLVDDLQAEEIEEINQVLWNRVCKSSSNIMKALYNQVIELLQERELAIELENVEVYQAYYSNNFDQNK
jgi:hypothetical protein